MPKWLLWTIIIIVVLGLLGGASYGIYRLVKGKGKRSVAQVKPNPRKCLIEEEDLRSNKVFDKRGTMFTIDSKPKNLTCDKCGGYYYKEGKNCVPYMFEEDENPGDGPGVCTVSLGVSEPCPF